jgi:hypothetical protein
VVADEGGARREIRGGARPDGKRQVLHGGDARVGVLLLVEARVDPAPAGLDPEAIPGRQADELVKLLTALVEVRDLDEERPAELAGARQEVVVGPDLVGDRRGLDDPLGADHLVDLVEDRLAVLEEERQVRRQEDAPTVLDGEDPLLDPRTRGLVLPERQDVGADDALHFTSSP